MLLEKGLPLIVRLMERVECTKDCWNWTGGKFENGYGKIEIKGKTKKAHRVSYELLKGQIPDGLVIDHCICNNKSCINPDHLEAVTCKVNLQRAGALITNCPQGHELSTDNLVKRKDGRRSCKTCCRVQSLARYHKNKQSK